MTKQRPNILFASALCGAGKTFVACRIGAEHSRRGEKVLIVQPSRLLIDQTKATLEYHDAVSVRVFHGGVVGRVVKSILKAIREVPAGAGCVFVISHAAFMLLPTFENRGDWHLIHDEVPAGSWEKAYFLPRNFGLLKSRLNVEPIEDMVDYLRVSSASMADDEEAMRSGDDIDRLFVDLLGKVRSQRHRLVVEASAWLRACEGGVGSNHRLHFHAVLEPKLLTGFKSVRLLGADIEDSLIVRLWRDRVTFVEDREITSGLQFNSYANGDTVTIEHLISDAQWSMTLANYRDETNTSILESVIEIVKRRFKDLPFLVMANNLVQNSALGRNAVRLPNSPHGLNTYMAFQNVVVMSAMNPSPQHFRFLESLGVDPKDVRIAIERQAIHQAVVRSALRDPTNRQPKTIMVMDEGSALWLQAKIPGSSVCESGETPAVRRPSKPNGRPRIHASNADKTAASRARVREKFEAEIAAVTQLRAQTGTSDVRGSLFEEVKSRVCAHHLRTATIDEMVGILRDFSETAASSKTANYLICPSVMTPRDGVDTMRGLANVESCWGIWLDFDGGDLTWQELPRLFPTLRMVIYASYSSTPERPRFRMFVPTDGPMTVAAYKLVVERLLVTITNAGYLSAKTLKENRNTKSRLAHGIDMGKLTPAALFYLPTMPAAGPAAAFFENVQGEVAGITRGPLDVLGWLASAFRHRKVRSPDLDVGHETPIEEGKTYPDHQDQRTSSTGTGRDGYAERVEQAVAKYRAAAPGTGNVEFYLLTFRLMAMGIPVFEVRQILDREAGMSAHPAERRAEIPNVIKNATKYLARRAA